LLAEKKKQQNKIKQIKAIKDIFFIDINIKILRNLYVKLLCETKNRRETQYFTTGKITETYHGKSMLAP
jgi:hypothetical protein